MTSLSEKLQHKIDLKTKPLGALGQLERLALQIGKVQNTLTPQLTNPHLVVFAGDHGIATEGVSAYPAEVTPQMVMNFLNEGAAINVFCRQNKIALRIVDAGVNADFPEHSAIINHKIAKGTQSFLTHKAMTAEQLERCFEKSNCLIDQIASTGCNIIGFGEMGIANTSSAAMLVNSLTPISVEDSVGRGTGLDDKGLDKKITILKQAKAHHGQLTDPKEILQTYGGFEVAQMTGAMLAAYKHRMLIMIDGYIATAAYLVASQLEPQLKDVAIFCHQSDEAGHRLVLEQLNASALLQLNLRVGEGTGCALAYPIIQAAVNFLNEMASFESAGVSNTN